MSYHVYFSFSTGLAKDMKVPKGTLERIMGRIEFTEKQLGLTRVPTFTPEGEEPRPGWRWSRTGPAMLAHAGEKTDTDLPEWWLEERQREKRIEEMAAAVRLHNRDIRWLYKDLSEWSAKTDWKRGTTERITRAQSIEFWGGLEILELPRELWTRDHFTDHMQHLHELFTTGESRGVSLNCGPFNPKQADALLNLFECELDQWGYDCRFAIPLDQNLKPYDMIAASYDGGYDWCSECGPIHTDDFHARCAICPHAKKGKCDLKNEHPAEFEGE